MRELELLQARIKEKLKNQADSIANGAAHDYSQYREMVGIMEGIHWAQIEIENIVKEIDSSDP